MWSTFYIHDDEGRTSGPGGVNPGSAGAPGVMSGAHGGAKRRARTASATASRAGMSESQEGKIKLAFFVAVVGIVLAVLGVGTEFWAELAPSKSFSSNHTCLVAHYGLWKSCVKSLWVADVDPERESCGPADLPGESNCTFFKFFTTGENAVLFQKTTDKKLSTATGLMAIFSLFLMSMGAICITMAISKRVPFFLKPASVCFTLSGILLLLSLIVFHQSVLALLASDHTVPLHHELSWSVSLSACAATLLIIGGILFLLQALPYSPWQKCMSNKDAES
ncbi:calcium channel, voltage-dependent, gamma subunit 6a [Alosa pseudoharengus]|uniref:calcium channel, voltage-dependent, gamma subunit 6a n=1 Tax=Alosa pseudoharengus TaxID=34774 RepID=UPI003F88D44F